MKIIVIVVHSRPMVSILDSLIKIFLAFLAGVIIGVDRERCGKSAGTRTQMLICVGSTMLSDISLQLPNTIGPFGRLGGDPARLMAQVVAGIGFVGAGVIIKGNKNRVTGVTTAATIWVTAAIGIAIGAGFYFPAFLTMICVLLLGPIAKLQYKIGLKVDPYNLTFHRRLQKMIEKTLVDLKITSTVLSHEENETTIKIFSSAEKNHKLSEILQRKKIKFDLVYNAED